MEPACGHVAFPTLCFSSSYPSVESQPLPGPHLKSFPFDLQPSTHHPPSSIYHHPPITHHPPRIYPPPTTIHPTSTCHPYTILPTILYVPSIHYPSCHQRATRVPSPHHLCSITSDVEDTPFATHEPVPTLIPLPTCPT